MTTNRRTSSADADTYPTTSTMCRVSRSGTSSEILEAMQVLYDFWGLFQFRLQKAAILNLADASRSRLDGNPYDGAGRV